MILIIKISPHYILKWFSYNHLKMYVVINKLFSSDRSDAHYDSPTREIYKAGVSFFIKLYFEVKVIILYSQTLNIPIFHGWIDTIKFQGKGSLANMVLNSSCSRGCGHIMVNQKTFHCRQLWKIQLILLQLRLQITIWNHARKERLGFKKLTGL